MEFSVWAENESDRFNNFIASSVEITKTAMRRIEETGDKMEGWQLFFPDTIEVLYGVENDIPPGGDLETFSHFLYHLASLVPSDAREIIKASYRPNNRGSIQDKESGSRFESLEQWCNWQEKNDNIPDAQIYKEELELASRNLGLSTV